jgi:peptide/nickel transport system ATP-binding protein
VARQFEERHAGCRGDPVLTVDSLRVEFDTARGRIDAVRGVSFSVSHGECLAIVGESGSGKTVTARSLVGLAGPGSTVSAARMELNGVDLTRLSERQWRAVRGKQMGLMLQDALVALDPVRPVGAEIAEALRNHRVIARKDVSARVVSLLGDAQVPEPDLRSEQYPHQLSGGLRQRALMASAMAADPSVLVADEPTTALDVTVQARILDLLAARKKAGVALLLISHDLSVVARLADRVAVMYQGTIVEEGPVADLLARPAHPYTRGLLAAVPARHTRGTRLSGRTRGDMSAVPTTGCRFAHRCALATERCHAGEPLRTQVGESRYAWCWRTGDEWPEADVEPVESDRRVLTGKVVLEVSGISKSFRGPDRTSRPAVRDVSFTLRAGETLGVLGESGSGKTTTADIVLGLRGVDTGTVRLLGEPWSELSERNRRGVRHRIQLVQQDPMSSFDPRYPVERIIGEAVRGRGRRDRVAELLDLVGLGTELLDRKPGQLSGGQRQRVAIARALAPEPDVLVCDEPVSALDVCIQAQILDLFADLRRTLAVAMVFISHDLGVIHHTSDRVIVMKDGVVVESGPVTQVFGAPNHPYTRELLAALPRLDVLGGEVVKPVP